MWPVGLHHRTARLSGTQPALSLLLDKDREEQLRVVKRAGVCVSVCACMPMDSEPVTYPRTAGASEKLSPVCLAQKHSRSRQ